MLSQQNPGVDDQQDPASLKKPKSVSAQKEIAMYFNGKNEMLSESSKEFIEKLMEKHETSSRSTPVLYHESMKYIQFFPNQRREGEVITVGLVNK